MVNTLVDTPEYTAVGNITFKKKQEEKRDTATNPAGDGNEMEALQPAQSSSIYFFHECILGKSNLK